MAVNYFDYDMDGSITLDGNAIIYEDDDAIKNAISMWLVSKRGEFLKNPNEGGILDFFMFKKMTTETLRLIGFSLQNLFTTSMVGLVTLNTIKLTPDEINNELLIEVEYTINSSGNSATESIVMNKSVSNKTKTYIEIEYIEKNLYEFVKIQKNSHLSQRLIFNTEINSWTWGEFKLINLTDDDSYFAQILEICNVN